MANVVLGVTGSIAAYRAADIARELMRGGCVVRVCLTAAAEKFVTRVLFESLTGQPCLVWAFDEPEAGRMAHIDWARQADLLLVAPATANILNKLAAGVADDMLSTIALAYTGPTLVDPAMNPAMYGHDTTRASIEALKARGVEFVEPEEGEVACGEHGQGKLASVGRIARAALDMLGWTKVLAGKRVLITSGPTREPLDSVRYLSNRSSGKMGAALAKAALWMGAEVTVVTGPARVEPPFGSRVVRVETAAEMLDAASRVAPEADLILGVAAVADYRAERPFEGKMRRTGEPLELRLVPNPDVLAELARLAKPTATIVGFAAEPSEDLCKAREKLVRKGLHFIAANDVSQGGIGFESDDNELVLLGRNGEVERSGRRSKLACARWLLERVVGGTVAS
ncbi:MAG: bifunctional phosphopantothenoylcysteine decarboxylase/phosphopantothenate--cysteine ligase CoaBC [Fimbriimonadales bacterium]|nr:bifunctional phosphopantothenoylcysteine decarboxylase/phosphopantothenate--cysteine ligase CoaBC [Fimbriimonadales bacterium]